jgi:hypothetical protein
MTTPPLTCVRVEQSICAGGSWRWLRCLIGAWVAILGTLGANAALQFDVFLGYDNDVREASWFPAACEVYNDGPSFNAVFELRSGSLGSDQVLRVPVELPTNTRKRFVIPVFAPGKSYDQWEARLLDDRGKVHASREGLQPKVILWETYLLGAMPRSFAGLPVLPDRQNRPDLKPQVARLQPEQFPDNPIALEGLSALYLNSEKALTLKVNQITALLAWVYEGGHLVVSVEQLADVNSTPWLQQLLPMDLSEVANVAVDEDLLQWLRQDTDQGNAAAAVARAPGRPNRPGRRFPTSNLPANVPTPLPSELPGMDPNFFDVQMPVGVGPVRDGEVVLAAKNTPLIVEASRGRGRVTVLTFSPEREPFRSWKHRALFWSKLLRVPTPSADFAVWGGWSIDGVFGALIDSRQIRKLPVEWLLLLLLVYLVVIGPFDQYILKKINRQMLTWVTFPSYVVLFSLLIYFIGYKLRAGETEWNELQVIDIVPNGERAALRGRTYVSLYSSANANYQLGFSPPSPEAAEQTYACLRGELLDLGNSKQGSRANLIEHHGNSFRADIFVPVWTSLLYVNDWFEPASAPFLAKLKQQKGQLILEVENTLSRPLTDARLVYGGMVHELGTLPAHETKTFTLDSSPTVPLVQWVQQHGNSFQSAAQYRHSPLGDASQGHLDDLPLNSMVASFSDEIPSQQHQRGFVAPPGFDLTGLVDRGDAVLMAWDAHQTYAKPINQFKPPRSAQNSLLRLAIPAPVEGKSTGSSQKPQPSK